ncbi:hypothetical protein ACSHWG_00910 [Leucobacter sp. Z1108]|uniref:hypothetical protein n=1 Tax=Leucobacter sp. Z1108 TaxID=3439066 RepID=UPI003F3FFD33
MAEKDTKAPSLKMKAPGASKAIDAHESELEVVDVLAGMPELRAPYALRLRHRNRLIGIILKPGRKELLEDFAAASDEDSYHSQTEMLEILADIDEFAESIATDPAEYAEWAQKHSQDINVFVALLNRYLAAVGE